MRGGVEGDTLRPPSLSPAITKTPKRALAAPRATATHLQRRPETVPRGREAHGCKVLGKKKPWLGIQGCIYRFTRNPL